MKILIYNFVQPEELGKQGGGVAVYQRNLTRALVEAGHEVISLSSGDRYSLIPRKPFMKISRMVSADGSYDRVHIYNSPFYAPAHTSFYRLQTYSTSKDLDTIPVELKARYGEIDVFHFQNIEGLTASFFEQLREVFPRGRILLSAHNYNIVCPQVNLWFRETMSCVDYRDGHACVNCTGGQGGNPQERNIRRMDTLIAHLGLPRHGKISKAFEFTARLPFRLRRALKRQSARLAPRSAVTAVGPVIAKTIVSPQLAEPYRRFRMTNIGLVNTIFDAVLAVSERTKEVLTERGLPSRALHVSYIGTAHKERFLNATRKTAIGARFHIAYLGYMRADKGFFFFMESLGLVPETIARNMAVTIAAPYTNEWPVERLRALSHRFSELNIYNGYTHKTLDLILADVDLGIVPVLWEDNLPQVAIEIVSRGIPILSSDRGGAKEIASSPDFVFKSGSKSDFLRKLERVATGAVPLARFWTSSMRMFSMEEHLADLMTFYRTDAVTNAMKAELAVASTRAIPADQ